MEGENDDFLEWPMRGKFSIELLNQKKNENHESVLVHFNATEANESNSRVTKGCAPSGYRISKFMSHTDLEGEPLHSHTQYLKSDTIYFRVATIKMESSSKPWLAGAIF